MQISLSMAARVGIWHLLNSIADPKTERLSKADVRHRRKARRKLDLATFDTLEGKVRVHYARVGARLLDMTLEDIGYGEGVPEGQVEEAVANQLRAIACAKEQRIVYELSEDLVRWLREKIEKIDALLALADEYDDAGIELDIAWTEHQRQPDETETETSEDSRPD